MKIVEGGVFHGKPFSPPGIIFETFLKDNVSNVFGRMVPNSLETAIKLWREKLLSGVGANWAADCHEWIKP